MLLSHAQIIIWILYMRKHTPKNHSTIFNRNRIPSTIFWSIFDSVPMHLTWIFDISENIYLTAANGEFDFILWLCACVCHFSWDIFFLFRFRLLSWKLAHLCEIVIPNWSPGSFVMSMIILLHPWPKTQQQNYIISFRFCFRLQ